MSGAIPPLLQYAYMTWCSLKTQGQLYLLLLGHYAEETEYVMTTWNSDPDQNGCDLN